MTSLLINEEVDAMDSVVESDYDLIYTDMLENVCERSQSHPNIIEEKPVIKYVIVLGKDNRNRKER